MELVYRRKERPGTGDYSHVKAIALYWKEGSEKYKEEAQKLLQFFQNTFNFKDTEAFAIPSNFSEEELETYLLKAILTLKKEHQSTKLLIVHYGGHAGKGESNGISHSRSMLWGPHANPSNGSASLDWKSIQDSMIKKTDFDTLLLLDCCYAGQAMRGMGQKGVFQILAAASADEVTWAPGPDSFTHAIMAGCKNILAQKPQVLVSELANLLCTAGFEVPGHAQPFLVTIREDGNRNIILKRLTNDIPWTVLAVPTSEREFLDSLNNDVFSFVTSVTFEGIFSDTVEANAIMARLIERHGATDERRDELDRAKDEHKNIIEVRERLLKLGNSDRDEILKIVRSLDTTVMRFLNVSSDILKAESGISKILKGIDRGEPIALKRRLSAHSHDNPRRSDPEDRPTLIRYRDYPILETPAHLKILNRDFDSLTTILAAKKSSNFGTLPLHSSHHEKDKNRFVLEFEVPQAFLIEGSRFTQRTLNDLIQSDSRRGMIRSRTERLQLACTLARSIRNWHVANWVLQSINSHNIIIFERPETGSLDLSAPAMVGFDLPRPVSSPSNGRYVGNLREDVYRHRARLQPASYRPSHSKWHDLYSLGVVLLEIGTWNCASEIVQQGKADGEAIYIIELFGKLRDFASSGAIDLGKGFQEATLMCLNQNFGLEEDEDDKDNSHLDQAFKFGVLGKLEQQLKEQE